jgi:hypothetical protein
VHPLSPLSGSPKNETVFEEAYSSFLELVPETERSQLQECHDAATLLSQLRNIVEQSPVSVQGACKWAHTVSNFIKKIDRYFEILNIAFASNSQYAAVAWGAVRFIFQVHIHVRLFALNTSANIP